MFQKIKINVTLLQDQEPLVAVAFLIIDEIFVVRSIRILHKDGKYFVGMPYFRYRGLTKNYVYFKTKETQEWFEKMILDEFYRVQKEYQIDKERNLFEE